MERYEGKDDGERKANYERKWKSLLEGKEKGYERANEAILDVVEQMGRDEVPTQVGAYLLLDRAISYCLHVFEHDDGQKMIDAVTRDHIANEKRDQN